jgi:hypothetical protein
MVKQEETEFRFFLKAALFKEQRIRLKYTVCVTLIKNLWNEKITSHGIFCIAFANRIGPAIRRFVNHKSLK